ncbi:MAG: hypothetical protein J6O41_01145, partial [Clostridia bacterium]|nr:hypothetical protein [Clostridia bacterium]
QVGDVELEMCNMNIELSQAKNYAHILAEKLNDYINNDGLISEAYNDNKRYIKYMHLPVLEGIELLCELLIDANNNYKDILKSSFGDVGYIDEDRWIEEYYELLNQYKIINNDATKLANIINQFGANSIMIQNRRKIFNNKAAQLRIELDALNELLRRRREQIERIRPFLYNTSYNYEMANALKDSIVPAIRQLESINISIDGKYYIDIIDYTSFENLTTAIMATRFSLEIQEAMGDETKSVEEYEDLSDDEKIEYINKVYNYVIKFLPDLAVCTKVGHVEVFVPPNMKFYFDVSVDGEIDDAEQELEVEATLEQNNIDLAGMNGDNGNMGINIDMMLDVNIIKYTKIDSDTEGYYSAGYNVFTDIANYETGVVTTISHTEVAELDINDNMNYNSSDFSATTAAGIDVYQMPYYYKPEYSFETIEEPTEIPSIPDITTAHHSSNISSDKIVFAGTAIFTGIIVIVCPEFAPFAFAF